MGDAKKDKAKGQFDKMKGEVKETYGKLTDDKETEISGKADKLKGEAKKKFGEFKEEDE